MIHVFDNTFFPTAFTNAFNFCFCVAEKKKQMSDDVIANMKSNTQLMAQQAEQLLYYKKEQLTKQVTERRDARIFELQQQVREARKTEECLRQKNVVDSVAKKNETILADADEYIDLVSPSSSPASAPSKCDRREVDETTPTKRQRTTLQPELVTPDGRVINRIIDDTPLIRLIEKTMEKHKDVDPGTYRPPVCGNVSCAYTKGCLLGQRLALVERLVQLERVLHGKNPSKFNAYYA